MIGEIATWIVGVPVVLCAAILLAGRPWRQADPCASRSAASLAALAIALAYGAANWGITGGPGGADPLNARLLYIAGLGLVFGLLDSSARLPSIARWTLRLLVSSGAAWLLLGPLATPQRWTALQTVAWIGVVSGANLLMWSSLVGLARRENGPSLALALAILGVGGSLVIVFSGLASTGQLIGALVAALGVALLISWRWTAKGRLQSAAPVIALLLVGHFTVGLLYAEMPGLSFSLLVLTAPALWISRIKVVTRLTAILALLVRLVAVGVPIGAALTTAAIAYFGETKGAPASSSSSGSASDTKKTGSGDSNNDDDYGYD